MDTRTAKRKLNQAKAKIEEARGPARQSQDAAPILDAIAAFHRNDTISQAIPAHKSGAGAPAAALEAIGAGAYRHDQTMLHGVDNRHESWEVQTAAQNLAAEALGADQCLFSTNGSTASVHTCLAAVVNPGEEIAIARNGHKSAMTGLILSGAKPVWLEAEYDEHLEIAHGVAPETVERALAEHPGCKAVMIFTPTYYGVCSNVPAIAEIAHGRELPLVCDEAWGLAYRFSPELPPFALDAGADLAVGSVHKTLGGLGQTSIISMKGSLVDSSRLSLGLELFETTSASSLLLAALDATRRQFVQDGERLIGEALRHARRLRSEIAAMGLDTMEPDEIVGRPGAWNFNELHVSFDVASLGITGFKAEDWLRGHRALATELADHRRLMLSVTHADTEESVARTLEAIRDLVSRFGPPDGRTPIAMPGPTALRTEQVVRPRDAYFAPAESVPVKEAAGRIAAEFLTPDPPGIPLYVPGERITSELVDWLLTAAANGVYVEGCADQSLESIRVVA